MGRTKQGAALSGAGWDAGGGSMSNPAGTGALPATQAPMQRPPRSPTFPATQEGPRAVQPLPTRPPPPHPGGTAASPQPAARGLRKAGTHRGRTGTGTTGGGLPPPARGSPERSPPRGRSPPGCGRRAEDAAGSGGAAPALPQPGGGGAGAGDGREGAERRGRGSAGVAPEAGCPRRRGREGGKEASRHFSTPRRSARSQAVRRGWAGRLGTAPGLRYL